MKKIASLSVFLILMAVFLSGCSCEHEYGIWTVKNAATCSAEGVEERACSKCDATEQRPLSMIAHNYGDWVKARAATCTAEGVEERACTYCKVTEQKPIPMIAHNYGDWVTTKTPTCTTAGESTKTCSVCKITETQTVSPTHTWKDATCTEPKICSVCSVTEGDALGHKWKDATYQAPKTCSVCSITEGEPLVPGVAIGGTYVQLNSVAGAELYIFWRNNSNKVIKYVTFTAVPYNAVGDIVSSTIGNKTYANLQVTGPVEPSGEGLNDHGNAYFSNNKQHLCMDYDGGIYLICYCGLDVCQYGNKLLPKSEYDKIYRTDKWDPIWYNSTIRKVVVTKIEVEYMDGSTETIMDPPIGALEFYSKYYS